MVITEESFQHVRIKNRLSYAIIQASILVNLANKQHNNVNWLGYASKPINLSEIIIIISCQNIDHRHRKPYNSNFLLL